MPDTAHIGPAFKLLIPIAVYKLCALPPHEACSLGAGEERPTGHPTAGNARGTNRSGKREGATWGGPCTARPRGVAFMSHSAGEETETWKAELFARAGVGGRARTARSLRAVRAHGPPCALCLCPGLSNTAVVGAGRAEEDASDGT